MTNPNNAVGTNAAYSGRTSPNALNDDLSIYTGTIMSGWACSPKTGMTVQLGGLAGTRDVAIAEDNAGNRLTVNNRSAAPVEITLSGAPATNNRIDAIVAYVDNPSTGDGSTTDNPTACGIIAVSGTVAANPSDPTDAQIRSAITTDGATGGSAYYAILAKITVGTGVTTIGSGVITQGTAAITTIPDGGIQTNKIADGAVTTPKLANGAVTIGKIDQTSAFVYEKIYDYEVTSGQSSQIDVFVPVDFSAFQQVIVETTQEPGNNASSEWRHMSACDSSKNELSTEQDGIEMSDSSSITGIHRTQTQILGYGSSNSGSCNAKAEIYTVGTSNYPSYFAHGFGGARRSEILHGRVTTGASSIKFIKVQLVNPKSHSRVWAYGIRRAS